MKQICIAIAILVSLTANSQQEKHQKDSFLLLEPIEVKAVRAIEFSPFTKTNISKKEIEKINLGQDLPFLLQQTPSVVVHSDAGNGIGYTGIRIRGTDATRINVTLNGVPFNDAESQGTFFVDLPDFSSSISSIQIQRGVGTSSNGTGAFGASINISTNEANISPYVELHNSLGSFNSLKNTIKIGSGLIGNHFTTDFRISKISSDGYIDRASSDLQSFYFSTAYFSKKSSLRFNVFSGKEKTYQAWYGVSELDLDKNRTINYAGTERPFEPYDNETDNYLQNHFQLFYNAFLGNRVEFNSTLFYVKGSGYYEQYKSNKAFSDYGIIEPIFGGNPITHSDIIRQLWLANDFYGNIFSFNYKTTNSEFTLGGGWNNYLGNHFGEVIWAKNGLSLPAKWYDLDAVKKDFTIYLKEQTKISNHVSLFYDLQFRSVDYKINGFRNNPNLKIASNYKFFNPKAGITFSKNDWLTYFSFSRGQKEPNREDFEANSNQIPKQEKLNDFELSVENKKSKYSWKATGYFMHYKDQLVLTGKINDVGAYTRTNIPSSYRTGIEIEGAVAIHSKIHASANITLSRNKILDFTEYIDDYDNGGQQTTTYKSPDIGFSPNCIASATVEFLLSKKLALNLLSKYVSKQYLDNTQNENRKLKEYYLQDMQLHYSLNFSRIKNASIILQANNIFNNLYEPNGYTFSYLDNQELTTENYYYPMAGRNFLIALNIKL